MCRSWKCARWHENALLCAKVRSLCTLLSPTDLLRFKLVKKWVFMKPLVWLKNVRMKKYIYKTRVEQKSLLNRSSRYVYIYIYLRLPMYVFLLLFQEFPEISQCDNIFRFRAIIGFWWIWWISLIWIIFWNHSLPTLAPEILLPFTSNSTSPSAPQLLLILLILQRWSVASPSPAQCCRVKTSAGTWWWPRHGKFNGWRTGLGWVRVVHQERYYVINTRVCSTSSNWLLWVCLSTTRGKSLMLKGWNNL